MRALASLALLPWLSGCNVIFGVEHGKSRPSVEVPLDGPVLYATRADLIAVSAKVDAGAEPWASAFEAFDADVQTALDMTPRSVVDNGAGTSGDVHAFATDSPGDSDCDDATTANIRHDYCAALDMSRGARDLAMAWIMSGDDRYAERAIDLLHHFLIAPDTAMSPRADNAGPHAAAAESGSDIEISLVIPTFAYAASFVFGHAHWQNVGEDAEAEVVAWMTDWAASASGPNAGDTSNYFYHLAALSAVAALRERDADIGAAVATMKSVLTQADAGVSDDGTLFAAGSTQAAWFHLKALTLVAELARHHGEDLYDFDDGRGGAALRRAFDAYAPCASGGATCPTPGAIDATTLAEGASIYELAHTHYQAASHLEAVEAHGRPVEEIRVLGWTTLTHGDGFALE